MQKLTFKAADVRRVVDHTLAHAAAQRPMAYTDTPVAEASIILVHDQGVYLMSNAIAPDLLNPADRDKQNSRRFVAYAAAIPRPTQTGGTPLGSWWAAMTSQRHCPGPTPCSGAWIPAPIPSPSRSAPTA